MLTWICWVTRDPITAESWSSTDQPFQIVSQASSRGDRKMCVIECVCACVCVLYLSVTVSLWFHIFEREARINTRVKYITVAKSNPEWRLSVSRWQIQVMSWDTHRHTHVHTHRPCIAMWAYSLTLCITWAPFLTLTIITQHLTLKLNPKPISNLHLETLKKQCRSPLWHKSPRVSVQAG